MLKKIESRRILSLSVAALISFNTFGSVFAEGVIKEDIKEPVAIEVEDKSIDKEIKVNKVLDNVDNKQAGETKQLETKDQKELKPEVIKENPQEAEIKDETEEINNEKPETGEVQEESPVTLEEEVIDETVLDKFVIEGNGLAKTKHTLKAEARSRNKVLYKFFIKDFKTNKWTVIQDYSEKNTADWTPSANGKYQYGVHIKDSMSELERETHRYVSFEIADLKPAVLERFVIEGSSKINTPHTLKAYANASNQVLYKFFIKDLKTNKWTVIQDYSEKSSAVWVPEVDGSYWYGVHIKDSMSKLDKDNHKYAPIKIEPIDPAVLENLTIEGVLEAKTPQTIKAQAKAENGVLYKFFVKDLKTNKWEMIQDYSDKNSVTWIPSVAGNYQYGVHVKDRLSKKDRDSHKYSPVKISQLKPAEIVSFTIEGSGYEKTNHTLRASAEGRNDVLYKFFVKEVKTNRWVMIQDYSVKNTVNWKPTAIGQHEYGVHVKDKLSDRDKDNHLYKPFTVNPPV
nr:hypothetical protein [Tissierella sp.]